MDESIIKALRDATQALEKAEGKFDGMAEKALAEVKRSGDISTAAKEAIDKTATEVNTLREAVTAVKAQLGEVEQHVAALPTMQQTAAVLSAGAEVVKSQALQDFAKALDGGRRVSVPITPQAALLTANVASIQQPDVQSGIDVKPKHRLFIRSLIAPGRTDKNVIFWAQETGFTNAAATVAENTLKPESSITVAPKISPVQTIAHLFVTSKQVMDDMPALMSLIDVEMRYGLKFAEEQEILFGDGTGTHLLGIIPQATAYSAMGLPAGATAIDTMRWAMLQSQLARVPATGHVLHFMDWAKIELAKDSTGRYIIGNPQGVVDSRMWGLPVVATDTAAMVGKFLTGSFAYGAQLFDREDMNVVISTEDRDNFAKNMITIRCEERLALTVRRPEAFIYGSLPA